MTAESCRFTADKETRGIAVIEAAGGGKTIAIRTVLQSTSALQKNPETGLPRYLEIQTPSPATHKSVGLAILEATGMSGVSSSARAWEIWSAVRNRLGQMGITVLWLDEAQDLVMAQSANETETTLRTIKTLMQGENAVIPILSGTRRLGEMTSFDPQVSRRFTKIAPSDLDHSSDQDNIFGMIDAYCNEAGISARLPEDLAVRLMTGSRYRFGRAIETIVNAIECAILDGEVFLTVDHFAEAWAMQEGCDPGSNIFSRLIGCSFHRMPRRRNTSRRAPSARRKRSSGVEPWSCCLSFHRSRGRAPSHGALGLIRFMPASPVSTSCN